MLRFSDLCIQRYETIYLSLPRILAAHYAPQNAKIVLIAITKISFAVDNFELLSMQVSLQIWPIITFRSLDWSSAALHYSDICPASAHHSYATDCTGPASVSAEPAAGSPLSLWDRFVGSLRMKLGKSYLKPAGNEIWSLSRTKILEG